MRDAEALLRRVRAVLCRPREPRNVGAAARALTSAGVTQLWLVDPQCDPRDPEAFRLAVHAGALLESARVVPSLAEALAGVSLSAGATARQRPERTPLSPRACAELLARTLDDGAPGEAAPPDAREAASSAGARAAATEVALVFGDERAGLTADEVEAVDQLTSISSAPAQPSWNLAQSVAVYAHELRTACLSRVARPAPAGERHEASPAQLAALDHALAGTLAPLGRAPTRRRLFRTLARARLTQREAALWAAVLAALQRLLR